MWKLVGRIVMGKTKYKNLQAFLNFLKEYLREIAISKGQGLCNNSRKG
jgi:hypothetical protein